MIGKIKELMQEAPAWFKIPVMIILWFFAIGMVAFTGIIIYGVVIAYMGGCG